ncbi:MULTISPECIES: fimbrial protein [Pseudomonas syringae group]|uniref:Type 1 fimbrial protein n=4 Tax=Pseudomonas syringae group TaxID=136849 RepID=A0AAD0DWU7_9PSED|nr:MULTISPECIES: fimbrial protein [Pseudomonas syringae group]AVB20924.1 type 1 fimbrial protein [Pseudomonas avellanae]EGH09800.1 fimbrial protein [Pseudomonas amygdali pv. morsprunorum str. M302280]KWS71140.1 fimbrial protein [Pseudomonas amygdali pv. morsprunorum]PHN49336.1 fimbrial protein [Pseudomonas avellanae]POC93540.1 fimbrial protein [Pseudomonas avellanae]
MNTASYCLASGLLALCASHFSIAMAGERKQNPTGGCYWRTAPAMKDFRRDIGALYVARDAKIGSVIGSVNMDAITPDPASGEVACFNDGTAMIEFRAVATAPVFPGVIGPINGEDVTGKILQTSIPGVGVRTKLGFPFAPPPDIFCNNCFDPVGGDPTVPYLGIHDNRPMISAMRILHLRHEVTLVKTGPIPSGPQLLDGSELWSGSVTPLGKIMSFGLTGTIHQAQCSVGANAVSADPVQLGEWDSTDFTGPGFTTTPVPFSIALSNCETDAAPGTGFVATAHIQLDGVQGSMPVGPTNSGVFSLTSDSTAQGMGIQVLKADAITPMELQTEVPLAAISPGNTVLNFNARFYQTDASSAIRPGLAKGALSFTMTYK